ncbi:MAG: tRNA lysidine(34) synthetase TilS [Actinomycetota bacterium]
MSCAVSGGADSLALLALANAAHLTVLAIHVDHGLRPGSSDEASRVAAAARDVGADFRAVSIRVEPGPNLEARAREMRYAHLPTDVLTGHTADDLAETIVVNLLRGAGLPGLIGVRPTGGPSGDVGHPLLALRRADTEAVCRAMGWTPFTDPTNSDTTLLRNRVRHEVIPYLNEVSGRDLVPILARQSTLIADDNDLLDALSGHIDPTDARALAASPPALARRAVRRWLTTTHPPDAATIDRVLAVARGEAVACEIPGGHRVSRRNQVLSLTRSDEHD